MIILDKDHTDSSNIENQITEAVSRGWCSENNKNKIMDAELALAIVNEIMKILK